MPPARPSFASRAPLWLLFAFLAVLFFAGGSSRADASGQAVVRTAAWAIVIALLLMRDPRQSLRAPFALLAALAALAVVQLIPLPPALWAALPGRAPLAGTGSLVGVVEPWRPISMAPSLTLNALASLIVPVAALMLMARIARNDDRYILAALLVLGAVSALFAATQIAGSGFANPLIRRPDDAVAGPFANRNHYALMLAMLVPAAVAWCMARGARQWRWFAALGFVLLSAVLALATGSRAGLVLFPLALGAATALAAPRWSARLRDKRVTRSVVWAAVGAGAAVLGIAALVYAGGRADAIERLFALDAGADLRNRARPVVLELIGLYMPVGAGLGTFDPVYRISEPDALLLPTYFNHAHSDWLELPIEGGIAAIAIMVAALVGYVRRSFAAWRGAAASGSTVARLGSILLLLVLVASAVDYPARTPLIMTLCAIAAAWLARPPQPAEPEHR